MIINIDVGSCDLGCKMKRIRKKDIIFGITKQDIQQLALEAVGRKLNLTEQQALATEILMNFWDWDNWIKELISEEIESGNAS